VNIQLVRQLLNRYFNSLQIKRQMKFHKLSSALRWLGIEQSSSEASQPRRITILRCVALMIKVKLIQGLSLNISKETIWHSPRNFKI